MNLCSQPIKKGSNDVHVRNVCKNLIVIVFFVFIVTTSLFSLPYNDPYMLLEDSVVITADASGIQTTRRLILSMLRDTEFSYDISYNTHLETLVDFNAERVYRDDRKFISNPLTRSEIINNDSDTSCQSVRRISIKAMRRGELLDCTYTLRSLQPVVSGFHVFAYSVPAQSSTITITHSAEYSVFIRHDSKKLRYKTSEEDSRTRYTCSLSPNRIFPQEMFSPPEHYLYPTLFYTIVPAQESMYSDIFTKLQKTTTDLQEKTAVFFKSAPSSVPHDALYNHLLAAITAHPDPTSLVTETALLPATYCRQQPKDIARALLLLAACKRAGIPAEPILVGPHRTESTEDFHPSEITGLYIRSVLQGKSVWYEPHEDHPEYAFSERTYRATADYGIYTPDITTVTNLSTLSIGKDGKGVLYRKGSGHPLPTTRYGQFLHIDIPNDIIDICASLLTPRRTTPYTHTESRRFVVVQTIQFHKNFELYIIPEPYSFTHKGMRVITTVHHKKRSITIETEIIFEEERLTVDEFFVLRDKCQPLVSLSSHTIILKELPKRKRFLGIF